MPAMDVVSPLHQFLEEQLLECLATTLAPTTTLQPSTAGGEKCFESMSRLGFKN